MAICTFCKSELFERSREFRLGDLRLCLAVGTFVRRKEVWRESQGKGAIR